MPLVLPKISLSMLHWLILLNLLLCFLNFSENPDCFLKKLILISHLTGFHFVRIIPYMNKKKDNIKVNEK